MATEINLQSKDWLNLIFDGRNKDYGAYVLRNESSKRHLIALFSVVFAFVLLFSFSHFAKMMGIDKLNTHTTDEEVIIRHIEMGKSEIPEENIKRVVEPTPIQKLRPSIKFTPPKVVADDQVKPEDDMPSQKELSDTKLDISVATIKNGDPNGAKLKDLDEHKVIMQEEKKPEVFDIAEIQPEFPGGEGELAKYLSNNIKYPVICQENNIQGQVVVQFVVSTTGIITDLKVVKGADKYLDAEAIRVLKLMPRWLPGKQGGVPVNVRFFVPVTFKLQ